jgi:hypothetical protein
MTTPGGFSNPIVAGNDLVIPQVNSPNFSLAGQTGWAILKNGLAYFFNVTLSGGTITGPDYIFNTQGLFFYAGTPAAGNLIAWFAPGSGTDQFGNTFTEGLNVGGTGQNISLIPAQNSAFDVTTTIAGTLEAAASLGSGDISQVIPGVLGSLLLNTGTAAKQSTAVGSPLGSGSAAYMILEAENDGGTDTPVITFGTAASPDGGTTIVYSPVLTLTPFALLLYGGTSGQVVVTRTSGSGTIPIPAGVSTCLAEAWGAGSGGQWASGPGGGGGEYAAEPALAVTTAGVAYAAGAGGAGGTSSNGHGLAGGNSTLTGTSVTVTAHGAPGNTTSPTSGGSGSTNTTHHSGAGCADGGGIEDGGGGGGSSGGTAAAGNAGSAHSGQAGGSGGSAPPGGGRGGNGGNGTTGSSGSTAGGGGTVPGGGGGTGGATNGQGSSGGSGGGAGGGGQVRVTYLPSTGAPAVLASIASAAGTDQFGNAYPAGTVLAGPGDTNYYDAGPLTLFSTSNQTISTTTGAVITGLSCPVAAGTYHVSGVITIAAGTVTSGQEIFFTGPSASHTRISGRYGNTTTLAAADTIAISALGSGQQAQNMTASDNYDFWFEGIVVFSAAGTFAVNCLNSTSGDTCSVSGYSLMNIKPAVASAG